LKKAILVSRGLPNAALDLIPVSVNVDYNGFEQALTKSELISRLKGRQGLICQIVDAVDDVVLAPHIGSGSSETRLAMAALAVRNCLAVLDGMPPLTPVTG
jgi:lactate dehydrogenase-like 2-hydroxyacid dehydrogenase